MILIVPKWLEKKVRYEMIAYCWLYIVIEQNGMWRVEKDRFGPQGIITPEEGYELIKTYQKHQLYTTLIQYH